MYHFFDPLLTIDGGTDSPLTIYLATKQLELSTIEQLSYVTKQETSEHISFNSDYLQRFKQHIHAIQSSIEPIQQQMHELLSYINDETLFPRKSFSILGTTYHSHLNSQAYFLFSPLQYDEFLEKRMFSIVELDMENEEKKIRRCSIGFSSCEAASLLQYPMDLQLELEKFDTMETIEASIEHMEYCRQLLLNYFEVDDIIELYDIEQSNLLKYIGDPLVLLRTIQKKHNDTRIKLSLQAMLAKPINETLVELIHVERRVLKQEHLRRFWEENQFTAYTKQLQQTKKRLMEATGISQEQLNLLMGQMPADFL